LEKTASEAIAGFYITTVNYKEAVAILKARFGNKLIINKHMDGLLNMAPVYSLSSYLHLTYLSDLYLL